MFKCKPERNPRQAATLLICAVAVTLTVFLVAALVEQYRTLIQLLGVLVLAVGIMLVVRYTMTEMEYTLSGDCLTIARIVGNKRTEVCVLDLALALSFTDKQTYLHAAEFTGVRERYNFSQNLRARSMVLVMKKGEGRFMVEFEPNAPFAALVEEAIEQSKRDRTGREAAAE